VSPASLPSLNVTYEKRCLSESIRYLTEKGLVELTWINGCTWRDLQRAMWAGPWHIFHFIGHGAFDRHADEGVICLEDENGHIDRMSATQLGRALSDHRTMRLVVLNSCEGARGGQQDIFSSTASVLVRRGIPAVLAMQYEITDQAAIEFSTNFYEALACGLPVDAAASAARKAISFAINTSLEWAIPVLFMRSNDGMLFNIEYGQTKSVTAYTEEDVKKLLEERRKAREEVHRQARAKVEVENQAEEKIAAPVSAKQIVAEGQIAQKQPAKAQTAKYQFPAWSVALLAIIFGVGCLAAAYFLARNPFIPVPSFPTLEATITLPPPVKSATSPPIIPIVFTVTSTKTAVPSLTNTPTDVFTETISVPHLGPTDPAEFVVFYFDTILRDRNFDLGWSLLTDEYKLKNDMVKQNYIEVWSATDRMEYKILSTQVLPLNRTIVNFKATFYYSNGNNWPVDLHYCLVRDESRNTWMIDSKSNCGL
jgi:CHAT domain-containing protein